MEASKFKSLFLVLILFGWCVVPADAQLSLNFNDGALPAGTAVYGATIEPAGGVDGTGYLQLNASAGSLNNSFIIEEIVPGLPVQKFTLSAKVRVDLTTERPADGFSFSLGSDLPNGPFALGEEGGTVTGLSVTMDVWDSSGDDTAPAIDVWVANRLVASQAMDGQREGGRPPSGPFLTDPETGLPLNLFTSPPPYTGEGVFKDLLIKLDVDGTLDVTWKGVPVFTDLPTGYTPAPGRFGFGSRTGGAWERVSIDDLAISVYEAGAPTILVQPQDQTVGVGYPATFRVAVDGTPPYAIQWRKDGVDIPGATTYAYTTPATTPDMDGAVYDVVVTNGEGTITSAGATLHLILDTTPPELVSVVGSPSLRSILVSFNEELYSGENNPAVDPFTYTLDPPVTVESAVLSPDRTKVTLQTGLQTSDTLYTLTVDGVIDVAGNPLTGSIQFKSFATGPGVFYADFNDGSLPEGTSVGGNAVVAATGGVDGTGVMQLVTAASSLQGTFLIENFNEGLPVEKFTAEFKMLMGGAGATATPADGASFCYGPDVTGVFGEEGIGTLRVTFDNYDNDAADTAPAIEVFYKGVSIAVQSMAGSSEGNPPRTPFITDPATGSAMSLMTGLNYANVMIRLNRDDTLDVSYKDVPIFVGLPVPGLSGLTGARFGIGARTGGLWADHFVDNILILTLTPGPVTILEQPQDLTVGQGFTATFSVVVDGSRPYSFQWRKDGVDIPGATAFAYTTPPTTTDLDGSVYDVVVANATSSITSAQARLTVIGDTTPPQLISAVSSPGLDSILLTFNEELFSGEDNPAVDPFTYALDPLLTIQSAVLSEDHTQVTLYTAPQISGTLYTLTLEGIMDVAGNAMPQTQIQFTGFVLGENCFFANFNNGQLPAGAAIYGTALVDTTGGVNDTGCLKLTVAANDQNASLVISDLQNGELVTGFDASFKVLIGGPGATYERIADGFSFNFGSDLPDNTISPAEDGAGNGLRVTLDVWDGGTTDTAPAIEVVYGGVVLATQIMDGARADARARTGTFITDPATGLPMTLITGREANQFADMRIVLNNNLTLDVWFKDVQIFNALPIPYVPVAGGKFLFAARTGGANENHFLDDVYICTTAEPGDAQIQVTAQPQSLTFGQGCEIPLPTPRFITDFSRGLPANSAVYGNAFVDDAGGVNNSPVLKVTTSDNGQNSSYIINDFTDGQPIPGFTANFKVRIADSTCCTSGPDPRPADGFSFNFSPDIPDGTLMGEEGVATGLVVSFDTWDNGGTDSAPAISVKYNGAELGVVSMGEPRDGGRATVTPVPIDPATGLPMTITTGNPYADVQVKLDPDGTVDVSYKGVLVLANVATGYTPTAGRFAFGARTGGANETHFIDNLSIVVSSGQSGGPPLDEDFTSGDGGFVVQNGVGAGTPAGPWTYDSGRGTWRANGGEGVVNSLLSSPPIVITESGEYRLVVAHRYFFEDDGTTRWDAGQIRKSINGGAYEAVLAADFLANGYPTDRTIGGNSPPLNGQYAFNGKSAGWDAGTFIESVASLGNLTAGTVLSIQFLGAWDEAYVEPGPNWEIDAVAVVSAGPPLADVTQPGDAIVGSSANTPAAEGVVNAIDNNSATKYLNFDELNTGFTVTPSAGMTIVRGLTLTSANDAPERDPASYTLEGSYDGVSFTLVASGTVPAFPARFAKNTILFVNEVPYLHYRLLFPTVANEGTANSMQIAEVELLGLPVVADDVTAPGDPVVPTSINSPGAEGVANAVDNSSTTKYLNFDRLNTGFTITPSIGSTIVIGLSLTSANDAPERDPATYTLEGSNDGATFTPISSGAVPAFSARFQKKYIFFQNTTPFLAYRLIFPEVVGPGGNSMQIAEVEFLGGAAVPSGDVTAPGDQIVGTSSNTPANEGVAKAIDNDSATKYLNFDRLNTGFTVTPAMGDTIVTGLTLTSANDAPERDPATYVLEGSSDGATFVTISSGAVPAFTARFQKVSISFANDTTFKIYRLIFPEVVGPGGNSMQIAEVELLGVPGQAEVSSATFTVAATATVDGRPNIPVSIQWQRDSGAGFQNIAGATGPEYTFPATAADNGAQFRALLGAAGVFQVTDAATLIVTLAPEVTITGPADGTVYNQGDTVTLVAAASDPDGQVAQVEFFADIVGSLGLATESGGAWSLAIPNVPGGLYEVTAVATDNNGVACASPSIMVEVIGNLPPVCEPVTGTTPEDTPVDIILLATDPDGDPLTYTVTTGPSHGTVSVNANVATYVPAPDYNGPDQFGFIVTDPSGAQSQACSVDVVVAPVNDPPTCAGVSATACEDRPIDIILAAADVDGDPLSYSIVDPPANGTVTVAGNVATYQGNLEYSGPDSFTFTVTDPAGASSGVCTVSVTVAAGNDSPVGVIEVRPTVDLGPTVPGVNVMSPNNVGACVVLDGTQSSDVDNDFSDLSFTWMVNGVVIGTGPVLADVCLLAGENEVVLVVDDNTGASGACDEPAESDTVQVVTVLTGMEASEELINQIYDSMIERKNKQQFIASLKNAAAAFERGSFGAGLNMLEALINKFQAQLKDNPDIQTQWIEEVQSIIDGMSEPVDCEGCAEMP